MLGPGASVNTILAARAAASKQPLEECHTNFGRWLLHFYVNICNNYDDGFLADAIPKLRDNVKWKLSL